MPSPKIAKSIIKKELTGYTLKRTKPEIINEIKRWIDWCYVDYSDRINRTLPAVAVLLWCAGLEYAAAGKAARELIDKV